MQRTPEEQLVTDYKARQKREFNNFILVMVISSIIGLLMESF